MKEKEIQVWRSAFPNRFVLGEKIVDPPEGWIFVEAGDAGLTRRIKTESPFWRVVRKWKNRIISVGLLAPENVVRRIRMELEAERKDPDRRRKLDSARRSREKKQTAYEAEFRNAILNFLDFAPSCAEIAGRLADAVVRQAVPVGSGTVARTKRIPIEQRAEAAVVAWMRHQTTEYDDMKIPKIKGRRREVRRMLAERSRDALQVFRKGATDDPRALPLLRALKECEADVPQREPSPSRAEKLESRTSCESPKGIAPLPRTRVGSAGAAFAAGKNSRSAPEPHSFRKGSASDDDSKWLSIGE